MKNTIFASLLTLSLAAFSHAATTITPANAAGGSTGFAQQILLAGAPYVPGTVMIGAFETTAGLEGGSIELAAFGWTMFGSQSFSNNAIAPGIFGAFMGAGQSPSITGTLPTSETGPFVGNDIFVVIANPDSSEFIIWNSNQQFAAEDAVLGGAAVSIQTRNAELIRGRVVEGGNTGLGGPIAAFNGDAAVTFIPEPSALLLGALGALGLLRRRRI